MVDERGKTQEERADADAGWWHHNFRRVSSQDSRKMRGFFMESGEGVELCTWRATGLNRDKLQHSWKLKDQGASADI